MVVHSWEENEDFAVDPRYQPANETRDLGTELGLPALTNDRARRCANAFILSATVAVERGYAGVRYSRDSNAYGSRAVDRPSYWTLAAVRDAVDHLAQATEYFKHDRQPARPPASNVGQRQSRLAFLPALVDGKLSGLAQEIAHPSVARVILRNGRGRDIALPADRGHVVRNTRAFLNRYDAQIEATDIVVDDPSLVAIPGTPAFRAVTANGQARRIIPAQRELVRIFSRDLKRGGRFYRVFWLALSKSQRANLRINDNAVHEYDYAACHPRLALAGLGAEVPAISDVYTAVTSRGHARSTVKRAIATMLNAKSAREAFGALLSQDGKRAHAQQSAIKTLMIDICVAFPALSPLWFSRAGLDLMFIDSEIMRANMTDLMDQGITALPVHDSAIVEAKHADLLEDVMIRNFEHVGCVLAQRLLGRFRQRAVDPILIEDVIAELSLDEGAAEKPAASPSPKPQTKNDPVAPPSAKPTRAQQRKLKSWSQGSMPAIVPINVAEPWHRYGSCRAIWFQEVRDKVDRQSDGLRALARRRDDAGSKAFVDALARLGKVKGLIDLYAANKNWPVHRLVDALCAIAEREGNLGDVMLFANFVGQHTRNKPESN
ncbi:MAG: hypothetical protein AAGK01_05865 [Pseudomonadota bacterium]